jgi:DNA-binding GntR family transcriptional regulator
MAVNRSHAGAPASVFRVARMSTVDLIAIELRNAIFSGALPVGGSIGEVEIAAQLGVSRSPLREAAQRLVQEGLLVSIPGRGLRVRTIGIDEIDDLYVARLAVESQAVRLIARRGEGATHSALERAFAALREASEGEDARTIGDADLAFHQALVDAAGSSRLSRMMATLAVETRLTSFSQTEGYTVRRSISPTYEALLAALRSGDADAGIAALSTQFDEAVARLTGKDDSVETVETEVTEDPPVFRPIDPAANGGLA